MGSHGLTTDERPVIMILFGGFAAVIFSWYFPGRYSRLGKGKKKEKHK